MCGLLGRTGHSFRAGNTMARFWACLISVMSLHSYALAQEIRIPAPAVPAAAPSVYRLSLEDTQQLALANNTGLTLGRLGMQEKSIAVDAARRDYFPKLLGNFKSSYYERIALTTFPWTFVRRRWMPSW